MHPYMYLHVHLYMYQYVPIYAPICVRPGLERGLRCRAGTIKAGFYSESIALFSLKQSDKSEQAMIISS